MAASNASLENEDCSDISDWTDLDSGTAVSEQITFDSKSTFKFDTNAGAAGNAYTHRLKNIGSVNGLGNKIVVSFKIYCDAIGTMAAYDYVRVIIGRSDCQLYLALASDGLFVYNGAAFNEVGTNLVVQDTWQEWTFDVDISAGVANAVCDVYLDNVLQASDVDCSYTGSFTDGDCRFYHFGYTTNDRISYIDWFKVGNGFEGGWTGKINGVINPAKIMGVVNSNIGKVMGVQ